VSAVQLVGAPSSTGLPNTRDQLRRAHRPRPVHDGLADDDASIRIQPPFVSCITLLGGPFPNEDGRLEQREKRWGQLDWMTQALEAEDLFMIYPTDWSIVTPASPHVERDRIVPPARHSAKDQVATED